ncbi:MAG: hypothetical protein PUE08_05915 [Eubacteriales bacterium]|nr:hypothetical protein [Eubacteriales bacterium]
MQNVSDYLKEYYLSKGKRVVVTTLTGIQREVCLSDDNKCFYSYKGLGKNNALNLNCFDGMVEFIRQNGGRVKKGSCRKSKVGYGKCTKDTLRYYIATECYGRAIGDSSPDPTSIVSAILEDAGICKNERGYIQLSNDYMF